MGGAAAAEQPANSLYIPEIPDGCTTVEAALLYAEAGWYVGPTKPQDKSPGSLLGNKWQQQSTRDPKQIEDWFTGERKSKRGIFLHVGKSGAIVFDLDNISKVPKHLAKACAGGFLDGSVPYQTTRVMRAVEEAHGYTLYRGHYVFKMPPGRVIGNSVPKAFGRGWGEVRGYNGVIIVAPSVHADAVGGGRYAWQAIGPLPELPPETERLLKDYVAGTDTDLNAKELKAWKEDLPSVASDDPACKQMAKALNMWLENIGGGAHDALRDGSYHMVSLAMEGHPGLTDALKGLYEGFLTEHEARRGGTNGGNWSPNGGGGVGGGATGQRVISEAEARNEAHRIILGAYARGLGASEEGKPISTRCGCFKPSISSWDSSDVGDDDAPDPADYEPDEKGLANHFLDLFGKDVRYVPQTDTWHTWRPIDAVLGSSASGNGASGASGSGDGGARWFASNDEALRMAHIVTGRISEAADQAMEAAAEQDDLFALKAAKSLKKWGHAANSNNKWVNLLKAARVDPGITVSANLWNIGQNIAFPDGKIAVLDDGKWVVRDMRREDLATLTTRVPYVPGAWKGRTAGAKKWRSYLDRFLPDEDLRAHVQKIMGYCLINGNPERSMIFLYGESSTGKTTMVETVMSALGALAGPFKPSLLRDNQDERARTDIVRAINRRFIGTSELNSHWHLHGDMIKRLTGEDTLSARDAYARANEMVERVPAFTPVVATNTPPTIEGADIALKRRLIVLPFNTVVPKRQEISAMNSILRSDAEVLIAVMDWLMEGLQEYNRSKMAAANSDLARSLKRTMGVFIGGINIWEEFFEDCCVTGNAKLMTPVPIMVQRLQQWVAEKLGRLDDRVANEMALGKYLAAQGVEKKRRILVPGEKGVNCYIGIGLKDEE